MRHQVGTNPSPISTFELITASYDVGAHPRNVCGRGDAVHPHHRVGYDGQEQVLPTEHAVFVLSQVLSVSPNSDQDAPPGAEAKSHVRWYAQIRFYINCRTRSGTLLDLCQENIEDFTYAQTLVSPMKCNIDSLHGENFIARNTTDLIP